jgi:hypothetical protein
MTKARRRSGSFHLPPIALVVAIIVMLTVLIGGVGWFLLSPISGKGTVSNAVLERSKADRPYLIHGIHPAPAGARD